MKVNTVKRMHHSDIKKHLKFLREVKRDLKRNPKHKVPKHPFKNKQKYSKNKLDGNLSDDV
mgnify:FL=1